MAEETANATTDLRGRRMLAIDTLCLAMAEYRDMPSDERRKHLADIASVGRVLWDVAMSEEMDQVVKDSIREQVAQKIAKFYGL